MCVAIFEFKKQIISITLEIFLIAVNIFSLFLAVDYRHKHYVIDRKIGKLKINYLDL